jgi:hypothetical protein
VGWRGGGRRCSGISYNEWKVELGVWYCLWDLEEQVRLYLVLSLVHIPGHYLFNIRRVSSDVGVVEVGWLIADRRYGLLD